MSSPLSRCRSRHRRGREVAGESSSHISQNLGVTDGCGDQLEKSMGSSQMLKFGGMIFTHCLAEQAFQIPGSKTFCLFPLWLQEKSRKATRVRSPGARCLTFLLEAHVASCKPQGCDRPSLPTSGLTGVFRGGTRWPLVLSLSLCHPAQCWGPVSERLSEFACPVF